MIHTIAFDADDTLWENLTFFNEVEANVAELLSDFCEPDAFARTLVETERRNISLYGYGFKTFTLCMLEAAWEVSSGRVSADTLNAIRVAGKNVLEHGVDIMPHVEDTLAALEGYRRIVITKGDLFHQEAKLMASGLSRFFEEEHVVSEKEPATYRRILGEHAERCVMVGNSPGSDIRPMLDAGGWAIFVPHDLDWELDGAAPPEHERLRTGTMSDVPRLVEEIEEAMRA